MKQPATTIYRLFAVDGTVLYVGCTGDWRKRLGDHREKSWWTDVARAEFTHVADRDEAFAIETAEIRRLSPVHNVSHVDRLGSRRLSAIAAERGLTVHGLAAKAGVTHQTVYNIDRGKAFHDKTLFALADALGFEPLALLTALIGDVSVEDLFAGVETREVPA